MAQKTPSQTLCTSIAPALHTFLRTVEARKRNDLSTTVSAIARDLGVAASQLRIFGMDSLSCTKTSFRGTRVPIVTHHARSLHSGPKSCLHDIEELLLRYIMEKREQGNAVDIKMVVNIANLLDVAFRSKSDRECNIQKVGYVHHHFDVHSIPLFTLFEDVAQQYGSSSMS
jgi:hypothetical protein